MGSCDLVLIAIRRSELLERTLATFTADVFEGTQFSSVVVNIDPIGPEGSNDAVKACVLSHFPTANFIEPDQCGFGAAVKNSWSMTNADHVFHLEDDWCALERVDIGEVSKQITGETKCLSLMHFDKNWDGRQKFDYMKHRPWYLPLRVSDRSRPKFTTSPSLWDGKFMRECATLMNPEFDPEKQFFSGVNTALESHVAQYKNRFLFGSYEPYLITDIGREWRKIHGIEKITRNAVTTWHPVKF